MPSSTTVFPNAPALLLPILAPTFAGKFPIGPSGGQGINPLESTAGGHPPGQ